MLLRRFNRRLLLADYLGWDYADLGDYRYQPSRFVRIPVYTAGDYYYCVTREGEKPPVCHDGGITGGQESGLEWVALPKDVWPLCTRDYAGRGVTIWRA